MLPFVGFGPRSALHARSRCTTPRQYESGSKPSVQPGETKGCSQPQSCFQPSPASRRISASLAEPSATDPEMKWTLERIFASMSFAEKAHKPENTRGGR